MLNEIRGRKELKISECKLKPKRIVVVLMKKGIFEIEVYEQEFKSV